MLHEGCNTHAYIANHFPSTLFVSFRTSFPLSALLPQALGVKEDCKTRSIEVTKHFLPLPLSCFISVMGSGLHAVQLPKSSVDTKAATLMHIHHETCSFSYRRLVLFQERKTLAIRPVILRLNCYNTRTTTQMNNVLQNTYLPSPLPRACHLPHPPNRKRLTGVWAGPRISVGS